jgi:YD repeat-containing protein
MAAHDMDPAYGKVYREALDYAAKLHRRQARKTDEGAEPTIPYLAHLLEVSALVWLGGGNETQAIAGLLHDALEDQGAHTSPRILQKKFGRDVRRIVEACTDGAPGEPRDESTWLERKVNHVAHLYDVDSDALVVVAADKVSNARAILDDDALAPGLVWARFNAPRQAIAWYYDEAAQAIAARIPDNGVTHRLERLASRLAESAGGTDLRGCYAAMSEEEYEAVLSPLAAAKAAAL